MKNKKNINSIESIEITKKGMQKIKGGATSTEYIILL